MVGNEAMEIGSFYLISANESSVDQYMSAVLGLRGGSARKAAPCLSCSTRAGRWRWRGERLTWSRRRQRALAWERELVRWFGAFTA